MGEQAGYVIILNISIFCEMVDKIFVGDATSDGMTVHSFVDADEYMTFDDKLVKGMFYQGFFSEVCYRYADPFGLRKGAAEVKIFDVDCRIASVCTMVSTVGDHCVPMELNDG